MYKNNHQQQKKHTGIKNGATEPTIALSTKPKQNKPKNEEVYLIFIWFKNINKKKNKIAF